MSEVKTHRASYEKLSMRIPAKHKNSTSVALKKSHRLDSRMLSLKQFARLAASGKLTYMTSDAAAELQLKAETWFWNKRANTSKNQLRIGRTNRRVKKGGSNKGTEKDLTGR